jgi:hypothetical protein
MMHISSYPLFSFSFMLNKILKSRLKFSGRANHCWKWRGLCIVLQGRYFNVMFQENSWLTNKFFLLRMFSMTRTSNSVFNLPRRWLKWWQMCGNKLLLLLGINGVNSVRIHVIIYANMLFFTLIYAFSDLWVMWFVKILKHWAIKRFDWQ